MSTILGDIEGMYSLLVSASVLLESQLQNNNSNESSLHNDWSLIDNISEHCQLIQGWGGTQIDNCW